MKDLVARLREVLDYNPDTGVITWKVQLNPRGKVGTVAGTRSNNYLQIQIDGVRRYNHNIAWMMVKGEPVPDGYEIDHIDTDGCNNAWSNFRLATKSQNQHNRGLQKNNTSGIKGVSFCKQTGKWKARVTFQSKEYSCGRHDSKESAQAAVIKKRNELHQEFSRNQ